MCGLVGIIAKERSAFSYKQRQMFEQMLFMDTLRGEDSTGIFGVTKEGNVDWWKDSVAAPDFLTDRQVKKAMTDIIWDYVAMVGHNRKATKGSIKAENAHPFVEEDIILVHNGTLTNHKDLNSEVEVDSHAIAHTVSKYGPAAAIKKLDGAFALSFYDVQNKKLYLVRNKERPLFLAEFEKFWAFASEPWMLFGTAWRNELKPSKLEEVPIANLLTFDFEGKETKLTAKEVKLFEPKKKVSTNFPVTVVNTTKREISTGGTKAFSGFLDFFVRDKVVCFKPTSLVIEKGGSRMTGVHEKWPGVHITCWMPDEKYTNAERITLNSLAEVSGRVVGHSANSATNNKTVFVTDLMESVPIFSVNGTAINDEMLDQLDLTCHKCKQTMSESDIEESYVKVRPSGATTIICPCCVEENLAKNKHWGNINASKETSHCTIH